MEHSDGRKESRKREPSYTRYDYGVLPEKAKRKALREVKRRFREILADENKLIHLIQRQNTRFYDDGSVAELIGLPTDFVTGGDGPYAATEARAEESDP